MRLSKLFTKTSKTIPTDETARNAQLLIQAGYIHKEMAGVYAYLPLGKKVLDNIAQVVREEMDQIGGQEVLLSVLQPKELWQKTDRWDDRVVDNWFKTKLKSGHDLGIGFTHEEPLTDLLKEHISSYKDLPVYIYQIQSKFRNELRAKSGLLRGREFLMKDLYSFCSDQASHDIFYESAAKAYLKIYDRLGLGEITYRTFASGGVFSEFSDEFQTISPVGEDTIYLNKKTSQAINQEVLNDQTLTKLGIEKSDLVEEKAVEVGNIFRLGSKYSDALGLFYSNKSGQRQSIVMGCYGIGISRLMGLLAEHFADDKGLVWPSQVAPASLYLIALGGDGEVKLADQLYDRLTGAGVSVIYDDRDIRAGQKFADADLLGIPKRAVISQQTNQSDSVELKGRTDTRGSLVNRSDLAKVLKKNST